MSLGKSILQALGRRYLCEVIQCLNCSIRAIISLWVIFCNVKLNSFQLSSVFVTGRLAFARASLEALGVKAVRRISSGLSEIILK